MNKQKAFDVVFTLIFIIALTLGVSMLVKGQETDKKPPVSDSRGIKASNNDVNAGINEIKIPELNLLRIQNFNLRFQLLANQQTQINQELQKIRVQIIGEVENLRDSLETDTGNWNVDLQRGVFTRKPKEEKKE